MGLHDEKMMKNWSNAYPDRAVVRFMHLVVFVPPSVSSLSAKLMHFSYQGCSACLEGLLTGDFKVGLPT